MKQIQDWDVLVVGAGPAGLAAAVAATEAGASTLVVERENRPGGILKQCIHDGFGLVRYKEKLTGPEYAFRCLEQVTEMGIPVLTETFLHETAAVSGGYDLNLVNSRHGVFHLRAKALVFATGCRERTARQVFIHGSRPAGVYTAGLAQYFINIQGYMPGKRCVILGSGDIGLIMARRLTLEGAEVEGVYEVLPEPSGLTRNVVQCLEDYNIPLHLSSTVLRVHGRDRVEGVSICSVDGARNPIPGSERFVACDSLILSVGLIPENECIESLGVTLDGVTGGPEVDQGFMSASRPGLFSCGNALHVSDLVDYVSETGDIAGRAAAEYALDGASAKGTRKRVSLRRGKNLRYAVPQYITGNGDGRAVCFFRSSRTLENPRVILSRNGRTILEKRYPVLRPPEMERLEFDLSASAGEGDVLLSVFEKGETP